MSVEQILQRHKIAQNKKDDFRSLYEDAMEFALPQRNLYGGEYEGKVGGKRKMTRSLTLRPSTLPSALLTVCSLASSRPSVSGAGLSLALTSPWIARAKCR